MTIKEYVTDAIRGLDGQWQEKGTSLISGEGS